MLNRSGLAEVVEGTTIQGEAWEGVGVGRGVMCGGEVGGGGGPCPCLPYQMLTTNTMYQVYLPHALPLQASAKISEPPPLAPLAADPALSLSAHQLARPIQQLSSCAPQVTRSFRQCVL